MTRAVAAALASFVCSGCFLAPGMRMQESALEERGKASKEPARFKIIPIAPDVIAEQARSRAAAEAARPTPPAPPAQDAEYRISAHDVLSIIVWDHPELTIPAGQFRSADSTGFPVTSEGSIFYPHVGQLHVAGRSADEVRTELTTKLARVIQEPQVQVLVAAFRGRRAQIAGEVLQPSPLPITDVPLRVQDAIAVARGFGPEADLSQVTLSREGKVYRLDLLSLYERGDTSQNFVLQDGDIVHVGDRSRSRVVVLGEVKKPSSKFMTKGRLSLAEAIGDSEGLDLVAGNPAQILVFRGQYDAPEIYRLDASSPDALLLASAFQLQARDVVFVAAYDLARFNRVAAQVLPTLILPTVQTVWQTIDLVRH